MNDSDTAWTTARGEVARRRRTVLVKACLNGGRAPAEHEAIPVTPPQLAVEATRAVVTGAAALHVHPRDPDGAETLDPGPCGEALAAIRRACPRIPVGLTTIARIDPDPGHRLAQIRRWTVLPDFVSLNFSEPDAAALGVWLVDRGIGIEAGLAAPADVEALAATGLAERCLRVLVEAENDQPAAALATRTAIDDALDCLQITAPRLYHGLGIATWAVIDEALGRGCDIRVGFEDTLVLPDGRRARHNGDLVAAAVRLVHGRGLLEAGA